MLRAPVIEPLGKRWNTTDSAELYETVRWGNGYFSVGENGNMRVHPNRDPNKSIELLSLMNSLQLRGLEAPVLLRFPGILRNRLAELAGAFEKAIADHEYNGKYCCVFPIKVNQQRQVIEEVINFGKTHSFGVEAGSKPEMLAVVAMTDDATPVICNGFKDDEFIQMAMIGTKIGRNITPVVEKYSELELIIKHSKAIDVKPRIGVRMRLNARGAGRWQESAGVKSKFGLTTSEILALVKRLEEVDMIDSLKMLHFHLGSQITNIRPLKTAIIEVARTYVDLRRRGVPLDCIDVGGGLGIDYDGSQTNFESSINYTLQEYANDVVYHIQNVCDDAEQPHPSIITESGRAIAAYHSALIFDVVGVTGPAMGEVPKEISDEAPQPLRTLFETKQSLNLRNLQESFHDAQGAQDMAITFFYAGQITLEERAQAESLFWQICQQIQELMGQLEYLPEELAGLNRALAETYFCNFSLFQSMPDSWAIKQLFPIQPIHRLNEKPTHHAVIGDITCDSDGKIDRFINRRDVNRTLQLHDFTGEPYYLGAFLIGAYQEILGDLHNLFGDTHAVHVDLGESGDVEINHIVKGDSVSEVLQYVEFEHRDLVTKLQNAVELAVRENKLTNREAGDFLKFYEDGLNGYTYLE